MFFMKVVFFKFLLLVFLEELTIANGIKKFLNLPTSCKEVMRNQTAKSGVYLINIPTSDLPPFNAYCDKDGWTIIQRRQDGKENFYRNWRDYQYGFGDLNDEFWLGLERLHALTKDQPQELWIYLEEFTKDKSRSAYYGTFYVAGEKDDYKLTVGNYSGNAGDSMSHHNGMKFSTFDRNNGDDRQNCPVGRVGAFWYFHCASANLNGLYRDYASRNVYPGIYWREWLDYESMRYVHMAIRPVN